MKALERTLLLLAVGVAALVRFDANAGGFDFSTTMATNWLASGGGAADVTPYQYLSDISVTSTAFSNGTFLPGGSLAQFDGLWSGKCAFFVPYGATNISLVYSNLTADDRAVFMLNGTAIGATGTQTTSGDNAGYMVFTDGGAEEPYTFSGPDATVSGSATSGFLVGATNALSAIVNNTRAGFAATTLRTLTTSDGTTFKVRGAVSWTFILPRLSIARSGSGLLVSWPAGYTGFQLQTTTNLLAPQSWSPIMTSGNAYMTSHTNRVAFFRLVRQ